MSATKPVAEFPGYFPVWSLSINGHPMTGEWNISSRFGEVRQVVVIGADGKPIFDRPMYREAPHVVSVVYGYDQDKNCRVGIIRQSRPHADDPRRPGDDHPPVVFGATPMGFRDKLINSLNFETPQMAGTREVEEEAGATTVIKVSTPEYPWENPAPSFCGTWADMVFIEVDLRRIEALKADPTEPIHSAEYITLDELIERIACGVDSQGAMYRDSRSNSAWMSFIAWKLHVNKT